MDEMSEIKELLREIRDLQKAHFERYKEFTQTLQVRQQADAERLDRLREDDLRYRDEQRRYRQEMKARTLPPWVPLVIAGAVLASGLGGVIVSAILGAFAAPR